MKTKTAFLKKYIILYIIILLLSFLNFEVNANEIESYNINTPSIYSLFPEFKSDKPDLGNSSLIKSAQQTRKKAREITATPIDFNIPYFEEDEKECTTLISKVSQLREGDYSEV